MTCRSRSARFGLLALGVSMCLAATTSSSRAGVNAEGVLLLHAATALDYTTDSSDYCGQSGLTACEDAVTSVPADPNETTLFFVIASFPGWATPSVKAATFGVSYTPSDLVLVAHGMCGNFELPSEGWPAPGTGTALTWEQASHASLVEVYWFAGYAASSIPTVFELTDHPNQEASFADDSAVPQVDPVAELGQLGFGMPGLQPNCDRADPDLTFIELVDGPAGSFLERLRALRRDHGFRVLASLSPDGIFCRTNPALLAELATDSRVALATNTEVPGEPPVTSDDRGPGDAGFARRVWNLMLEAPTPPDPGASGPLNPQAGCLLESLAAPRDTPAEQTSTYLMGDVGVSLLILESAADGPCDAPDRTESWTASEKNSAVARIVAALREFADLELRSQCAFHVFESPTLETSVEPIQQASGASTWQLEAMGQLGFAGTNPDSLAFALNNARRRAQGTDWWYTAYLVRDVCDPDKRFADGMMSSARRHGPSMTLLYINGDDPGYPPESIGLVAMHETAHVFGAVDEHQTSASCDGPYGYLRGKNQNRIGCLTNYPCLMRNGPASALCADSRKQIGWNDWDGDTILDPIDQSNATRAMFIGTQEPLLAGDRVDVYSGSTFVRALSASEWSSDFGRVAWDGIGFDGLPRPTGTYQWTRDGSAFHTLSLANNTQSPTITKFSVAKENGSSGKHWLNFRFQDLDTRSGRAQATIRSDISGARYLPVIRDQFYVDNTVSGETISVPFSLPAYGSYTARLTVWDMARRSTSSEITFWHTSTSDAAQSEPLVAGLKLLRAGPAPSSANFAWSLVASESGVVDLDIVGVDGRRIRSWQVTTRANEPTPVQWDARNDAGLRASSGRYFLVATTNSGARASAEVTLLR